MRYDAIIIEMIHSCDCRFGLLKNLMKIQSLWIVIMVPLMVCLVLGFWCWNILKLRTCFWKCKLSPLILDKKVVFSSQFISRWRFLGADFPCKTWRNLWPFEDANAILSIIMLAVFVLGLTVLDRGQFAIRLHEVRLQIWHKNRPGGDFALIFQIEKLVFFACRTWSFLQWHLFNSCSTPADPPRQVTKPGEVFSPMGPMDRDGPRSPARRTINVISSPSRNIWRKWLCWMCWCLASSLWCSAALFTKSKAAKNRDKGRN